MVTTSLSHFLLATLAYRFGMISPLEKIFDEEKIKKNRSNTVNDDSIIITSFNSLGPLQRGGLLPWWRRWITPNDNIIIQGPSSFEIHRLLYGVVSWYTYIIYGLDIFLSIARYTAGGRRRRRETAEIMVRPASCPYVKYDMDFRFI